MTCLLVAACRSRSSSGSRRKASQNKILQDQLKEHAPLQHTQAKHSYHFISGKHSKAVTNHVGYCVLRHTLLPFTLGHSTLMKLGQEWPRGFKPMISSIPTQDQYQTHVLFHLFLWRFEVRGLQHFLLWHVMKCDSNSRDTAATQMWKGSINFALKSEAAPHH